MINNVINKFLGVNMYYNGSYTPPRVSGDDVVTEKKVDEMESDEILERESSVKLLMRSDKIFNSQLKLAVACNKLKKEYMETGNEELLEQKLHLEREIEQLQSRFDRLLGIVSKKEAEKEKVRKKMKKYLD
jgi:hypothetical protein